MKKVHFPLSYLVLTLMGLSLLLLATACGGGGGGGGGTPPPDATPTPEPTATPGIGSTPGPTPTPVPTPVPVGRSTPVPGPSPTPWGASSGPILPTTTDKAGAWISNVYQSPDGHQYVLVLANTASTNYAKMTWLEAQQAAAEKKIGTQNGHLVTITTLDEQRGLMSTFDHSFGKVGSDATAAVRPVQEVPPTGADGAGVNPLRGVALGGIRQGGNWQWVTGEPFDLSKGYWLADFIPDNQGGKENYLQIYTVAFADSATTARYGWNDYAGDSDQTFGYIVEFEP